MRRDGNFIQRFFQRFQGKQPGNRQQERRNPQRQPTKQKDTTTRRPHAPVSRRRDNIAKTQKRNDETKNKRQTPKTAPMTDEILDDEEREQALTEFVVEDLLSDGEERDANNSLEDEDSDNRAATMIDDIDNDDHDNDDTVSSSSLSLPLFLAWRFFQIRQFLGLELGLALRRWSPVEWHRLAVARQKLEVLPMDWAAFFQGLAAIFIPLLVLVMPTLVAKAMVALGSFITLDQESSLSASASASSLLSSPSSSNTNTILDLPEQEQTTALALTRAAHWITNRTPSLEHVLLPYLFSPWMWHFVIQLVKTSTRPLRQAYKHAVRPQLQARGLTLPRAKREFQQAWSQRRAFRTANYDLYLPPKSLQPSRPSTPPTEEPQQSTTTVHSQSAPANAKSILLTLPPPPPQPLSTAILVVPGSGVEHKAYARPARLLSNYGYTVVVLNGEPWRFVSTKLSPQFSPQRLSRKVLQRVERQYKIQQWCLVGHSLGAFTSSFLLTDPILNDRHNIRAAVFWAIVPFFLSEFNPNLVVDDDDKTSDNDNDGTGSQTNAPIVGVIQASQDGIMLALNLTMTDPDFWKLIPPLPGHPLLGSSSANDTTTTTTQYDNPPSQLRIIPNATHAGFANYISANEQFREDVSVQRQQQDLACRWTHEFLQKYCQPTTEQ